MPSQADLVLRLLLAATLAGILGIERELTEQPAGFRTHILVGLGAALFTLISAFGFEAVVRPQPSRIISVDVTRVASQVVVGIGFLGGGAIIKYGASVRGLTTAASLWITAAIGTAVGIGMLLIGAVATGIALVALVGLRPLRGLVRRYAMGHEEYVVQGPPDLDAEEVTKRAREVGAAVLEVRVDEEAGERAIHLVVHLPRELLPPDLAAKLAAIPNVRNVDWVR